jgi:glycosyltransferase involved in cell wall biosynthesis
MENIIYHHSQRIITVTEGFRNNLIIRGIPENKIIHIPNGANTELFQNRIEAGATVRNSFDIGDSFLVLYAGIHGIAQGLEHVIKAAKLLRKDRRIKFLFVGEGPVKEKIAALSRHNDLDNVFFHGEVPRNDMPDFFSAADVALVPLKKLDIFKITIPSKLFDAWACECPVIMGIEGEAQHLLHKSGAGRFVEPENSKALTEAIQSMSSDRSSCRVMGTKGRAFVKACYSRSDLAHKLENVLKTISTKNV